MIEKFNTKDIVKTKYNEIGVVLDIVPLGYYLWAKDFSDTGFHPLYNTLEDAIKLGTVESLKPKDIKLVLDKYKQNHI